MTAVEDSAPEPASLDRGPPSWPSSACNSARCVRHSTVVGNGQAQGTNCGRLASRDCGFKSDRLRPFPWSEDQTLGPSPLHHSSRRNRREIHACNVSARSARARPDTSSSRSSRADGRREQPTRGDSAVALTTVRVTCAPRSPDRGATHSLLRTPARERARAHLGGARSSATFIDDKNQRGV